MEYLNAFGRMADPLVGTGADFVFVAADARRLVRGITTDARGEISEKIDARLQAVQSGSILGRAFGCRHIFLDAVIFDGLKSINLLKKALTLAGVSNASSIHYFAKHCSSA
jgi:hypothetical protein